MATDKMMPRQMSKEGGFECEVGVHAGPEPAPKETPKPAPKAEAKKPAPPIEQSKRWIKGDG